MGVQDLTLVETKKIIDAVRKRSSFDFNEYIQFPLQRSFERCMTIYGLQSATSLIDRILNDKHFIEEVIKEVSLESTEMFRDPSFWQLIRDKTMPSLFSTYGEKIKVWFPYCVSGDELYTFLILLKENGWLEKTEVHASCHSNSLMNGIKNGIFKQQKLNISSENYKVIGGKQTFGHYIQQRNGMVYKDTTLSSGVNFFLQPLQFSESPAKVHLIIYRNKMIYFNQSLQEKVLHKIYDVLVNNGLLALGVREQIEPAFAIKFKCINREESIFKKI